LTTGIGAIALVESALERRHRAGSTGRSISPSLFHLRAGDHPIAWGTSAGDPIWRAAAAESARGRPCRPSPAPDHGGRLGWAGATPETITPSAPPRWSTIRPRLRHGQRCHSGDPWLDEHDRRSNFRTDLAAQAPAAPTVGGAGPSIHALSVTQCSAEHIPPAGTGPTPWASPGRERSLRSTLMPEAGRWAAARWWRSGFMAATVSAGTVPRPERPSSEVLDNQAIGGRPRVGRASARAPASNRPENHPHQPGDPGQRLQDCTTPIKGQRSGTGPASGRRGIRGFAGVVS